MIHEIDRELLILADSERVSGFGRAWLSGREELNLFPAPFMLRLWNLQESDDLLLSRAREVSVSHEGSVLAAGRIADVFRRTAPEGTVTYVCFSPGLPLWEVPVSLSVEAGASVSDTVRRILEASGTGIRLLGWTGSPEECVRTFGSVPAGAFLFIHAFDGREVGRGYRDGLGNASHIGIRTGRGKGAIHSSAGRGCVAESEFHDRTVRNGGWNMVGLWNRMDYGKTVSWVLEHSCNSEFTIQNQPCGKLYQVFPGTDEGTRGNQEP